MPLPHCNFHWVENPEDFLKNNDWRDWELDQEIGWWLEVGKKTKKT